MLHKLFIESLYGRFLLFSNSKQCSLVHFQAPLCVGFFTETSMEPWLAWKWVKKVSCSFWSELFLYGKCCHAFLGYTFHESRGRSGFTSSLCDTGGPSSLFPLYFVLPLQVSSISDQLPVSTYFQCSNKRRSSQAGFQPCLCNVSSFSSWLLEASSGSNVAFQSPFSLWGFILWGIFFL